MTVLTRDGAEALLVREARLLDELRLDEWQALLTDDIELWAPLADTSAPGEGLSIIYEGAVGIRSRAWRILDSDLDRTQDPATRTLRLVTNVDVEAVDDGEATVSCVALLWLVRSGAQRSSELVAHPMRCHYQLRLDEGTWKIARKTILLLERDSVLGALTNLL